MLTAGAGCVETTPRLGVHLAGDVGAHRPAEGILDPLYARALAVSDGSRKVCFVSADLTIIPIREAFARGGHEVSTSTWAKLPPEALDTIVAAAAGLLRELL
ncbi:MAG: hypothetical protein FJ291_30585 [Planctomycetes bacterium]|nr:hypothetical protein [Planctomycetota bacterium]